MIDIEPEVFDGISEVLTALNPNMNINDELVLDPEEFPCVCISEINNSVYRNSIDSGSNENHVSVDYEFNVYSNKQFGRKTEAKLILSVIDQWMIRKGFVRIMSRPVDMDDGTKTRLIARYTAVTDGEYIYRR